MSTIPPGPRGRAMLLGTALGLVAAVLLPTIIAVFYAFGRERRAKARAAAILIDSPATIIDGAQVPSIFSLAIRDSRAWLVSGIFIVAVAFSALNPFGRVDLAILPDAASPEHAARIAASSLRLTERDHHAYAWDLHQGEETIGLSFFCPDSPARAGGSRNPNCLTDARGSLGMTPALEIRGMRTSRGNNAGVPTALIMDGEQLTLDCFVATPGRICIPSD